MKVLNDVEMMAHDYIISAGCRNYLYIIHMGKMGVISALNIYIYIYACTCAWYINVSAGFRTSAMYICLFFRQGGWNLRYIS